MSDDGLAVSVEPADSVAAVTVTPELTTRVPDVSRLGLRVTPTELQISTANEIVSKASNQL